MLRRILIFGLLSLSYANAQKVRVLTLEQCFEMAGANSQQIKAAELQKNLSEIQYKQAEKYRYPTLNSTFQDGLNVGRNIDPFTNLFVTKPIHTANLGLTSSYTLYDAGVNKFNAEIQKTDTKIAEARREQLVFDIKRELILAYLDVVLKQDALQMRNIQKTLLLNQLNRQQDLVSLGNAPTSSLIELEALMATENFNQANAEAQLKESKVQLLNLLNSPNYGDFEVKMPTFASTKASASPKMVGLPGMQVLNYEIDKAKKTLAVNEAAKKPIIYLDGSAYTNYSSQAGPTRNVPLNTDPEFKVENSPTEFVSFNNSQIPLQRLTQVPAFETKNFGYLSQLMANNGLALKINVQYPIFDRGERQSRIEAQKVQVKIAQANFDAEKQKNENEIKKLKTQIDNANLKHKFAELAVLAEEKSFDAATLKFSEGRISIYEFNQAKISLETARSNALQNKYLAYYYQIILSMFSGL